ncbi:homoserine kinase [Halobacteriales archaeon SW_8_65_20]|nr:MAG: homoserine kinase [Halobacteriales archaeon SW_6_65_46]PSQ53255.1 MAG: homoserine kinase [Halobacteriales archaeon SW_8_65_20]
MLRVRAPATSANLGSGFDTFGVALDRPSDVVAVEKADRTSIEVSGVGARFIPEDPEQNTVGAVADALDAPARISIEKGVRPASGLGSSAASAAAAAVALNELYERQKSREELVPIAAEGEAVVSGDAHADNVAPSILGGFTIARDDGVTRLDADISLVVCLPELVISTRDARQVVPEQARMPAVVETVRNAATLTAGIARSDPTLVGRGMDDPVVTPARAELIDGYEQVRRAAFDAGASGVTISGAGPGILAVCPDGTQRDIALATIETFADAGIEARAFQTAIGSGATLL